MLIINFPSNPTAQCVELPFFEKIIALAKEHGIWVVHDLAYADICFDGWKAPSIMQVPGARDVAVEFFTMSKSYNMAGWRIGFMVGNRDLVYALSRIKGYHDYGTFTPIQVAAIAALEGPQDCVAEIAHDVPEAARRAGQGPARGRLDGRHPEGVDVRLGEDSGTVPRRWARSNSPRSCWRRRRCRCRPGIGFGEFGDGYVRFAMIENEARTRQAIRGIKQMFREDGLFEAAGLAATSLGESVRAARRQERARDEAAAGRPARNRHRRDGHLGRALAATPRRSRAAPGGRSASRGSPTRRSSARARRRAAPPACTLTDDAARRARASRTSTSSSS